jgi:hypothetical protein
MAGLVPGHLRTNGRERIGRNKPGHDGEDTIPVIVNAL